MLEFLKLKSFPSSQISQLQAVVAEGRRQAASGQIGAAATGATTTTMQQGGADAYSQWQNFDVYSGQSYMADYGQHYGASYQQQMPQMGYYNPYAQGQMIQMPMYAQQYLQPMQPPQFPAMPLGIAPTAVMPGLLPSTATPANAVWPASTVSAAATDQMPLAPSTEPLATNPAPAAEPEPGKKAAPRHSADKENVRAVDKENAAPAPQVSKDAVKVQRTFGETVGQRQAI